jgi:hypothetical protein
MRAIYAALALLLSTLALGAVACFSDNNSNPKNNLPDVGLPDVIIPDANLPDIQIPDGGIDVVSVYSVGGTVNGLVGSGLVLEADGSVDVTVTANGTQPVPFTFPLMVPAGLPYSVVVKTQPSNPTQMCTVANGTGTVSSNVTSIVVNCSTQKFAVGGSVTGLLGQGLVLQNNGGDSISIPHDGGFAFPTKIASGSMYAVTVSANPTGPTQTCNVAMGSGSVVDAAITTVQVTCSSDAFTIGGQVSGLTGSGLVLEDNGGDDLPIAGNMSFTFATKVASGMPYNVTVKTPPSNPAQNCTVSAGMGTVAAGNVTGVLVNCATDTFTVGGTVSGLAGTGLTLTDNGGTPLPINSNGQFAFPPVASGTGYNVMVGTQPANPTQSCSVTNGMGTVAGANVTNIVVACTTTLFHVGGTVTGLTGSGLVLENDQTDDLAVMMNGPFQFAVALASGSSYSVAIKTPPSGQQCYVTGGTGVVPAGDVTTVQVTCIPQYPIGGTATNVRFPGLQLVDNWSYGTDTVAINSSGSYVFPTSIPQGDMYAVSILTQPTNGEGPAQNCVLENPTSPGVQAGTVSGPVSNVNVLCDMYQLSVSVEFFDNGAGVVGPFCNADDVTDTTTIGTSNLTTIGKEVPTATITFPTLIPAGTAYTVTLTPTVKDPLPNGLTCLEGCNIAGSGTMPFSNLTIGGQCFCNRD